MTDKHNQCQVTFRCGSQDNCNLKTINELDDPKRCVYRYDGCCGSPYAIMQALRTQKKFLKKNINWS